jgi:hypothetical protein
VTLAVALHESGAPPVLATVNCVCAATQVLRVMVVGWTLRVAGTAVAVGAAEVGVAAGDRPVAVGAAPWVVVAVIVAAAPERDCDDELEFEDELLLEEDAGARMIGKRTWSSAASSAARSKAMSTPPTPRLSVRRSSPLDACGS